MSADPPSPWGCRRLRRPRLPRALRSRSRSRSAAVLSERPLPTTSRGRVRRRAPGRPGAPDALLVLATHITRCPMWVRYAPVVSPMYPVPMIPTSKASAKNLSPHMCCQHQALNSPQTAASSIVPVLRRPRGRRRRSRGYEPGSLGPARSTSCVCSRRPAPPALRRRYRYAHSPAKAR
jgi:hypothetical protein